MYEETALCVVQQATVLKLGGLGWGSEELLELCAWLPSCDRLVELNLIANRIDDTGARALADVVRAGGLSKLRVLHLSKNQIGPAGVRALGDAVAAGGLPHLGDLAIGNQDVDNELPGLLLQLGLTSSQLRKRRAAFLRERGMPPPVEKLSTAWVEGSSLYNALI